MVPKEWGHLIRFAASIALVATFATFCPASARTIAAPDVTITTKPGAICLGEAFTFSADGTPPGGNYTWTVTKGKNKVTPNSGTGKTFTVTGIAVSDKGEDVMIKVNYMGVEDQCSLTVVKFDLESVTFGGPGFRGIVQDNGTPYSWPQWSDGAVNAGLGNRQFPLLYVRNTRVAVNPMVCKVTPAITRNNVQVKGTELFTLSNFAGTGTIANSKLTSGRMDADRLLPNAVDFFNPYTIFWEVSVNGVNFCNLGVSFNRLYVSLASPVGVTLYETVVHIACSNPIGANTQQKVIDGIFPYFKTLDVHRKPVDGYGRPDNLRLSYYVPYNTMVVTYSALLGSRDGNGQCSCWSQLLQATTRVHGMDHNVSKQVFISPVTNVPPANRPDGFLVQRWAFDSGFVHTGPNGRNDSTRRGDDNQIVPQGQGSPYTICIRAAPGRALASVPGWDDTLMGSGLITTGPDGICDTVAVFPDTQVIVVGNGMPRQPCILAGANKKIDSNVIRDDATSMGGGGTKQFPFEMGKTAINLLGIAGQNQPEPPPSFNNHWICEILGQLYDPSYGSGPYAGATRDNDYENAAVAGLRQTRFARPNNTASVELNYQRR